ncbi:MAG: PTS sugar transporter subunit IIA [Planctomycetota bacterium]|jgi:PTS system nitrogen regulatory IIA component
MEITELIGPGGVVANLRVTSKKQALQELAKRAAELTGQPERAIFDGKLADLDRLYALFARLETPIDFDAIDEHPVDLICVLLAPETAGADHLKALARVSRLLRDRAICDKLRGTDSAEAIRALLTESTASHAA